MKDVKKGKTGKSKQKRDEFTFNKELLNSLDKCTQAGMTSKQITSLLLLASGLFQMCSFDDQELVERVHQILKVIKAQQNVELSIFSTLNGSVE